MKRTAGLIIALAVVATACSGSDDPAIEGAPSGQEVPGPVPTGGVETSPNPVGVPVPEVPPTPPGLEGGPTTVDFQVLEATTEPLGNRSPRPLVLLMRSPSEANLVFEKLPAGARDLVIAHRDWNQRSLILFTGGAQPDPNYRVVLKDVGVIGGGKTVQVFARFRVRKGNAAEVISEPWVLFSVKTGFAVLAEECLLVYPQTSAIQTDCH